MGQQWVELWVVLGYSPDGEDARQVVNPNTGDAALHLKIEDGKHPLEHDQALGKCDVCGQWHKAVAGGCEASDCHGVVRPYDGHARLVAMVAGEGLCFRDAMLSALYRFLTSEEVPDPVTGKPAALLEGTKV